MKSLRARIFLLVAGVTLLVWSSAAAWTYSSTRAEVQWVLDRRLVEAARMVSSLVGDVRGADRREPLAVLPDSDSYSRQLSCQIWTVEGELVGRSAAAPSAPLSLQSSGFSERHVEGETWRVYTLADPDRGIRVMVGDNLEVRQRLVGDLMTGLLLPSLVGILALALLIWAAVGTGLSPLREIVRRLKTRRPSNLGPLGMEEPSTELVPVVQSIDELFQRLDQMRSNEKHFIASAAHELQTPLAGLRMHAQIARMTDDEALRRKSLNYIQTSVDRTSRLVQQLLELAREEAMPEFAEAHWLSLRTVIWAVQDALASRLQSADVALVMSERATAAEVLADEGSLMLALRNLVENAINHSPRGSTVRVDALRGPDKAQIAVLDSGPGIPTHELDAVRGRFVRGAREKSEGSGLGLSIIEVVAARNDARLDLQNRPGGGLWAALTFPADRVRITAMSEVDVHS